jgi:TRAP-type C4-dicarboxylate transport system substrate-binding protein
MSIGWKLMSCFAAAWLLAGAVRAEPAKLKLAMFSSDSEMTWVKVIKPWAEQVNAAGKGVIEIDMFPNGALGRALPEQAQMVMNGVADIAFVVPGVTPGRFPDNEAMDLPGLFNTSREATETYTHLVSTGQLKSFKDYYVVGAMATQPFIIYSRTRIADLKTLAGKKIRVTNASQAETMKALGAVPILIPVSQVAEAIGRGTIDGATEFPGPLVDFGIDRVTRYTYVLPVGVSSLTLLMNKKKYESLPPAAKKIIDRYSGEWVAKKFIGDYGDYLAELTKKLRAEHGRTTTFATKADVEKADAAFHSIIENWSKKTPANAALVKAAQEEVAKLRAH